MSVVDEAEGFAEDTLLTDVLGRGAKPKIVSALLVADDRDLNATEIAELAGVDRTTFYNHIERLLAYGIVEKTRTVGNSTMYQINEESDAAKALGRLEWALMDVVAEKESEGGLDADGRPLPPENA